MGKKKEERAKMQAKTTRERKILPKKFKPVGEGIQIGQDPWEDGKSV